MAVKKLWRCHVCNDIHYGIKGPAVCPTCGAKNAFSLIDYPESKKVIIDRGDRLDQVDQLLEVWEHFAEGKPFRLNPDSEFVRTLARGELENQNNHGLKYCPCRLRTKNWEEDLKLVCPCNFPIHETYKDVKEGECWCGLFVRRK
jgi:ferredoxin-thioredoxin reductase catalytic subunit